MLRRCISAEWMKLRRSRIAWILMLLPIISVFIGSTNFHLNQGQLTKEWYSLWSQVGLFYGEFFLPILIAILCAYMWRLEHLNQNWNMMMTAPISASHLFLAKWIVVSVLLAVVQLLFLFLYLLGGQWAGLTSDLPGELAGWLFRGWFAAVTISTLQLALSMRIRSFAAPVGIGLCGVFIGLGLYVTGYGIFFPHSLLTIGMGVLSQTTLSPGNMFLFSAMNLLYMILIMIIVVYRIRKSDVTA